MSTAMSPTDVYEALHDAYLRYLETSFHLKDPSLLKQFRHLLHDKSQPPLVRRPILEVSPGFKSGTSIEQLIEVGILTESFRKIEESILGRSLYSHQEKALRKAIQDRRNLVVATGTGSGKTEIFLYPIINHLLRESDSGTLKNPGARAAALSHERTGKRPDSAFADSCQAISGNHIRPLYRRDGSGLQRRTTELPCIP